MSKRNSLLPVPDMVHLAASSPADISRCSEEKQKKYYGFCRCCYNHQRGVPISIIIIASAALSLLVVLQQPQYYRADGSANIKAFRGDVRSQAHNYYVNIDQEEIEAADPNYALAREQSFGFFYDITNEHWNLYRQLYLQHENHRYPEKPLTYNPEAREEDAVPEIYANRNSQWKGWSSYEGWYQTVSMC